MYSTAGMVFCGWACPQNTMSEWANNLTHKLLGKHAEVSLTGEAIRVAGAKNKALNWFLLGISFLGAAMFFALIPLFYFYQPSVVWSFITFQEDARLASSLHWIYAVCVVIIFIDIAMIRHFWCRYACIYRVWMHSFKTRQTLRVAYDASRKEQINAAIVLIPVLLIWIRVKPMFMTVVLIAVIALMHVIACIKSRGFRGCCV